MVERLVGYAKTDLMVPQQPFDDLTSANAAAAAWCDEVNAALHAEICAVPADRLATEQPLLGVLPSLRLELASKAVSRKVDRLSCVRFGSARYSVPSRLIGHQVTLTTTGQMIMVIEPVTGEVLAEHRLVAPGEVSIVDAHYGSTRPDRPSRAPRPRTQVEKDFLALGPVAEAFLVGAATAGVSKLPSELAEVLQLQAAHGTGPLLAALARAVQFRRWRAADIRSILAAAGAAPNPQPAGQALVLTLPTVPTRSLDAYKINNTMIHGEDGAR
jgi:hypothetical protein